MGGSAADAGAFVDKMLVRSTDAEPSSFFQAAVADMQNWQAYLDHMLDRETSPLEFEQIYREINKIADDDAIYSIDVGDNIINSFRYLKLTPKNKWVISALFASMGSGVPGALAAQLSFPNRQVFHIAGDA